MIVVAQPKVYPPIAERTFDRLSLSVIQIEEADGLDAQPCRAAMRFVLFRELADGTYERDPENESPVLVIEDLFTLAAQKPKVAQAIALLVECAVEEAVAQGLFGVTGEAPPSVARKRSEGAGVAHSPAPSDGRIVSGTLTDR